MKKLLLVGVLFLLSACTVPYDQATKKLVKPIVYNGKSYAVYEVTTVSYALYPHDGGTPGPDSEVSSVTTSYSVSISGVDYPCYGNCSKVIADKVADPLTYATPTSQTSTPEGQGESGGGGSY